MIEEERGAYPPNADSIGIDIYLFAIVLPILSPVYAAAVWLATRCYQGGLSLLAFDTRRPLWGNFWSLLLGSLILVNLYDAVCKAKRILPLEVLNDFAWMYLLLCLRSSLAGGKVQQNISPAPKRELGEDIPSH